VERCAQAHAEVAARKQNKRSLKAIAEELGISRGTLNKMCTAHGAMRSYEVTLAREGSPTMRVCTVVTPKGALSAAIAAFREYPGTLKGLELPGWRMLVNAASFPLEQVRAASAGGRAA